MRKDIIIEDDETYANVIIKHLRELRVNEDKDVKLKNIRLNTGDSGTG